MTHGAYTKKTPRKWLAVYVDAVNKLQVHSLPFVGTVDEAERHFARLPVPYGFKFTGMKLV